VPDEDALLRAEHVLNMKGVRSIVFYEPDMGNIPTALATEYVTGSTRKLFSKYPLWGKE